MKGFAISLHTLVSFALVILLVWPVPRLIQAGLSLGRETTLRSAMGWGLAAHSAWITSTIQSLVPSAFPPWTDQLWYWTTVLSICPLIAVLGARRPTCGVWNLFILVPLVLVLGWPAVTEAWNSGLQAPLQIQTPVLAGFFLILVMGIGNYLGTRNTVPALMAMGAVLLVLATLSGRLSLSPHTSGLLRLSAAGIWSVGSLLLVRRKGNGTATSFAYDRVWLDFRDAFGIVWSIRIQERINNLARKERWTGRLSPLGWEWDRNVAPTGKEVTIARLEHAVRWHLRRFVDPRWIDRRLADDESLRD